ncbi:MAG TPA: glycosyltransferase family 39 protein [Chloroflexota bacterium]|nr:glycosyltransferase family 39 protein [Chloroflexota bacterium]
MTVIAEPDLRRHSGADRETSYRNEALLVAALTLLGLAIRLYRLDTIPAEMWGDVLFHHYLASLVLGHQFYLDYRFGGDGPMLSYIIAGLSALFGLTFFTIKLATVLAGTLLVPLDYLLTRQLFGRRVAAIAALLTAISFWAITFSRQGKPYILAAVFFALALWLVLSGRQLLGGVALGLGMYTQAAFWGAPLAFVTTPYVLLWGAIVALPVIVNFARNPSALLGSSSYIGSKLHQQHSATGIVLRVLDNIWRDILSYNVRGDATFRHNIPYHPNLDRLSGIFFVLGVALILWRIGHHRDWRLLKWVVIPFAVIQIPSVLDQTASNIPAMGRMVGAVPLTMATIAYALDRTAMVSLFWLRRLSHPRLVVGSTLAAVLIVIFGINFYNYFVVYPRTLPNGNTPFGATIATRIDQTSPRTYSFVIGCCWGDWGQPEPDAVSEVVTAHRYVITVQTFQDAASQISTLPRGSHVLLFMDPATPSALYATLPVRVASSWVLRRNGWDVARVLGGRSL